MKLRNKRFWIFEGTIMSTVLIFGIIYLSCGFSELIGASIYGVFFHLLILLQERLRGLSAKLIIGQISRYGRLYFLLLSPCCWFCC